MFRERDMIDMIDAAIEHCKPSPMKHSIEYDWENIQNNLGYCIIKVGELMVDSSTFEINTSLRNDKLIAPVVIDLINNLLKLKQN